MLILIDNYDSFTYNLYQYLGEIDTDIEVHRNDKITVQDIIFKSPKAIIISPGPGRPNQAGICIDVVKQFSGQIPILGICLGHQAIGETFGCVLDFASNVMHGKLSTISHDQNGIFKDIPKDFEVVRYHSLSLKKEIVPECIEFNAFSEDGTVMALRHKTHLTFGVQFHPESILSRFGKEILKNFYDLC